MLAPRSVVSKRHAISRSNAAMGVLWQILIDVCRAKKRAAKKVTDGNTCDQPNPTTSATASTSASAATTAAQKPPARTILAAADAPKQPLSSSASPSTQSSQAAAQQAHVPSMNSNIDSSTASDDSWTELKVKKKPAAKVPAQVSRKRLPLCGRS